MDQHLDNENGNESDSECKLGGETFWWNVIPTVDVRGQLKSIKRKGRARKNTRRSISLQWDFSPSPDRAATRSPPFEYLGENWCIRFQRSPYDSGIMQPPAWSIFLDLMPPYGNVFRVSGRIDVKHDGGNARLWKFDVEYQPAWPGQDVCTWCRKRLDLDKYVKNMQSAGKDICIQLTMSSIGLGRNERLLPIQGAIEKLPFILKVGTKSFARRFGWNLQPYFSYLTGEQITYWKSIHGSKSAAKKFKFGPMDLAKAVKQDHLSGICTWRVCKELKAFVIRSIHEASSGWVVIPYHLIFMDFDLMDGSDDEAESGKECSYLDWTSPQKYDITIALLDWIVRYPLVAGAGGGKYLSEQEKARRDQMEKCFNCQTSNNRDSMSRCARCMTAWYCSADCQRKNWRLHKKQCKNLAKEREEIKKKLRLQEKVDEEKRASDFQTSAYDDYLSQHPFASSGSLGDSKFGAVDRVNGEEDPLDSLMKEWNDLSGDLKT